MDIELLRTFLEVNRTGHFGRAADNLFLTQSAVSARIKQLEESLGTPVFERQRNNIRLTSSGLRFLHHAETIVATWQRARQEAGLAEIFSTSLAIAGLSDLWDPLLIDWLVNVRENAPDISLHASAFSSPVMIQQLLNGQLDLGFLFEPPAVPELETRYLKRMTLILVSTRVGLAAEKAVTEDYVMVDWGAAYAVNHAKQFPDAPSSPIFMSHGRLALSYILRNGGSTYLPEDCANPLISEGKLFPVKNSAVLEREVSAIWRTDNDRVSVIKQVLDYFDNTTR
jgi:DNA-binding transcriptional LysR family regulator